MKKYKVEFEFMCADADVSDGKWHKDYLDNNGAGFNYEDACDIAMELHYNTAYKHRNIIIVEMEG